MPLSFKIVYALQAFPAFLRGGITAVLYFIPSLLVSRSSRIDTISGNFLPPRCFI